MTEEENKVGKPIVCYFPDRTARVNGIPSRYYVEGRHTRWKWILGVILVAAVAFLMRLAAT